MKTGICAIMKNEDFYADEWIDYHLKLGIDQIVIFQNNWRYPQDGKHREDFHVHWYVQDGEVQQLPAYNRFLQSQSLSVEQLDWCAFIDADEYICIKDSQKSLKDILEQFSDVASIAVNWRLFGDSGLAFNGKRDVVTRFTKCEKTLNRHVKQIINLKFMRDHGFMDKIMMVNPHCGNWAACSLLRKSVIGPFNYDQLDKDNALELNHYAVKTWDECLEKCNRGRADYSVKRDAQQFFNEHNKNDIENSVAKDFYVKYN